MLEEINPSMQKKNQKKRSRVTLALKVVICLGSLYLVATLAVAGVVILRYRNMDLSQLEPTTAQIHSQPEPEQIQEGAWGPRRPFPMYEKRLAQFRTTINSAGWRNTFADVPRGSGSVVLLGDSYFFGYGVHDEDTIAHLLQQQDRRRYYVNLAHPAINLLEAVSRYENKWRGRRAPELIILQVFLNNDITSERFLGEAANAMVDRDAGYILPPVSLFLDRDRLFSHLWAGTWEKIYSDMSPRRFDTYIRHALVRLQKLAGPGTRLAVVLFADPSDRWEANFRSYISDIAAHCRKQKMAFFEARSLVGPVLYDDRSWHGHPTPGLNKALARRLYEKIRPILARGGARSR